MLLLATVELRSLEQTQGRRHPDQLGTLEDSHVHAALISMKGNNRMFLIHLEPRLAWKVWLASLMDTAEATRRLPGSYREATLRLSILLMAKS